MILTTRFITFYSYKGGVGRTMALGNVAYKAAKEGQRVVVLDFDLEAPGITHMDLFKEKIDAHLANKHKLGGLFELICHYREKQTIPSLKEYYATAPLKPDTETGRGELSIIPAGKLDTHYIDTLQSFNWERFFKEEGGALFFNQLREHIIEDFNKPHLVFIDSRTGLTDIGGICTVVLPDQVVLLGSLNDQNTAGTCRMIKTLEGYSAERKEQNYLEPIEIILVGTPVPYSQETDRTNERRVEVEKLLGRKFDLLLPYTPRLALHEEILMANEEVLQDTIEIISRYRTLYERLSCSYSGLEKEMEKKRKEFGQLKDYKAAEKELKELTAKLSGAFWPGGLLGEFKRELSRIAYREGKYKEAGQWVLEGVERLDLIGAYLLKDRDALNELGVLLCNVGEKIRSHRMKEALYQKALDLFSYITEFEKSDSIALYNIGFCYGVLAELKEKNEKVPLYLKAIEKCKKAIEIDPEYTAAFNGWGICLSYLARLKPKEQKEPLYNEAIDKFEKALTIEKEHPYYYGNRGEALTRLAELKKGRERELLLEQALDNYEKALSLDPELYSVYAYKGFTLTVQGEGKEQSAKQSLLEEALKLCRLAVENTPDFLTAAEYLIRVIQTLAPLKPQAEASRLLAEAEQWKKKIREFYGDFA